MHWEVLDANGYLKTRGAIGATGDRGATGSTPTLQTMPGQDGAQGDAWPGPVGPTGPSGRVQLFDSTLGADTQTIDTGALGIAAGSNCLDITILARTDEAVVGSQLDLVINADTSNLYDREFVRGENVTASASNGNAQPNWPIVVAGASCAAGVFSVIHLWIPCYTQTVAWKTGILEHARVDTTVANSRTELQGCLYRSTAAITRFSITAPSTKKLLAGSRLLIIGV